MIGSTDRNPTDSQQEGSEQTENGSIESREQRMSLERRASIRSEVGLECLIKPRGVRASHSLAQTINLSRNGVLIRWPEAAASEKPTLGQHLVFDILLPSAPEFGQRIIACQGRIVRVSAEGARLLVAATIQRMNLKQTAYTIQSVETPLATVPTI
jgi:hypothetical protein